MSALTLTLKSGLSHAVDCSALTPNLLAGLSMNQISNISLGAHKVSDLFSVSGNDTENIIFKNITSKLDYIGFKMTRGSITIQGDAGNFLGANLQNGTIICQGNVGERLGDSMRRGLILVDGNAGNYAASRMIAGTIGVYGNVGDYTGYLMRRGTLLLTQTPPLHATMADCGTHQFAFLNLLWASLKGLPTQFAKLDNTHAKRYCGDIANNGKGEILVLS